jgi:hypothetical protein
VIRHELDVILIKFKGERELLLDLKLRSASYYTVFTSKYKYSSEIRSEIDRQESQISVVPYLMNNIEKLDEYRRN